jgi:hypothetical protein
VSLTVLSNLTVGIAGLWLYWRIKKANEQNLESGLLQTDTAQSALTGFVFPRFILPFLDFEPTWEQPLAKVDSEVVFAQRIERVSFVRRGFFSQITRRFYLADLFGLAEVRWRMSEQRIIEVWPHTFPHRAPFARSFLDGNDRFVPTRPRMGDLVDTRPYFPGDPVRLIHWKLFARSNEPFVRISEPSASLEHQILAYLITDEYDDIAARTSRWDIEQGQLGVSWIFGADHCDQIASEPHSARRLLALSGVLPPAYGAHLESFLQAAKFRAEQHRLLFYASGNLSAWLPNVLPVLKRHTKLITLTIASEDDIAALYADTLSHPQDNVSTKSEPFWKRLFLYAETKRTSRTPNYWQQLQQLQREGLQLQIVHSNQRPTAGKIAKPSTPPPHPKVGQNQRYAAHRRKQQAEEQNPHREVSQH